MIIRKREWEKNREGRMEEKEWGAIKDNA